MAETNKPAIHKTDSVKYVLRREDIQMKFRELLNEKAAGFMANLVVIVGNSQALSKCTPDSVIMAATIAASLDLSLDPNLGQAAIVPYNEKQDNGTYQSKAQFQMMYKGFVQLAMRSGQYRLIGATAIMEGQLVTENPLTGEYEFDFKVKGEKPVGYAAYFKLANGFEKTEYWPIDKVEKHAKRYSKTFAKYNSGIWVDDFDAMAKKTVLKSLLKSWGMLSIQMQKAVQFDQAVVTENLTTLYPDNPNQKAIQEPDAELKPGHKDWNDAKQALTIKAITIEQLMERYEISDENLIRLQDPETAKK